MASVEDPARAAAPAATPLTRPVPDGATLCRAILETLVYADLFDYPLTGPEVTRYLIGCPATAADIDRTLREEPGLRARVSATAGYYYLRGRENLVAIRAGRTATAGRLRRRAGRYLRVLRGFPFVRMMALTGALAMDNVEPGADIDLLVIAQPGRVWICRRLLVLAVRAARLLGDEICPNFILAADHLALPAPDLFTAHELAQMQPIAGYAVYQTMLTHNAWMGQYLPNAAPWAAPAGADRKSAAGRVVERLLGARWLNGWEAWERRRLVRRHPLPDPADTEVAFTPYQCKGHTSHYRRQVLQRYEARLAVLEETVDGEFWGDLGRACGYPNPPAPERNARPYPGRVDPSAAV